MQDLHDPVDIQLRHGSLHSRVRLGATGDDLPLIHSAQALVLRYQSMPERLEWQVSPTSRYASVELYVPAGARAAYGALGAEFTPALGTDLTCRILWSQDVSAVDRLDTSIPTWGHLSDTLYAQLPKELASAIAAGIYDLEQSQRLISGSLAFTHSIYGEVGSSPHVFRALSRMVAQIVQRPMLVTSQEALSSLLQAEWKG